MQDVLSGARVKMGKAGESDFLKEIDALETQFDVVRYMKNVTGSFGFRHFFICKLPDLETDKLAPLSIISSVPADVMNRYDSMAMVRHSIAFKRLRKTTMPFQVSIERWTEEAAKVPGIQSYVAMMKDNGIEQGNYFPVHDADGARATVLWMGARNDLPMSVMMELQMIAICVYNRLIEIGTFWKDEGVALSERELQCLNWTAAGKTSSEIAGILGLSEHTVNHYLNHVTKKLEAMNRTQAVVKAIRKGYIR